MGMMQPNKGVSPTHPPPTSLADALFPKVRQHVLAVLFGTPDRTFYANEVIALAQSGLWRAVWRIGKRYCGAGSQGQPHAVHAFRMV